MNPFALLVLVLAIAGEVIGIAGLKGSEGFGWLGPSVVAVLECCVALREQLKVIRSYIRYHWWPVAA